MYLFIFSGGSLVYDGNILWDIEQTFGCVNTVWDRLWNCSACHYVRIFICASNGASRSTTLSSNNVMQSA